MLTGSVSVLLVPSLTDSLAGRIDIQRLHPLAQCELARGDSNFLDDLFSARFKFRQTERLAGELGQRIAAGGYPAVLTRANERRRTSWYRDCLDAIVQRDARELARISSLDAMSRLLSTAATQSARLFNVAELAAPFQLSHPTIRDYMTLLERLFLLETLPPWHSNRLNQDTETASKPSYSRSGTDRRVGTISRIHSSGPALPSKSDQVPTYASVGNSAEPGGRYMSRHRRGRNQATSNRSQRPRMPERTAFRRRAVPHSPRLVCFDGCRFNRRRTRSACYGRCSSQGRVGRTRRARGPMARDAFRALG